MSWNSDSTVPSDNVTASPEKLREFTSPPDSSWSRDRIYRLHPALFWASTHSYSAARSPYWVPLGLGSCPSRQVWYRDSSGMTTS